ncbi:hypothetical protein SUGI_0798740 [Cryptomeria japonica]|nr:hypothetical protein SUGI_0798740 [Cryptomeria japonica]
MTGHPRASRLVPSWIVVFLIVVCFSICSARSLPDSIKALLEKGQNDEIGSLQSELDLGDVVKSSSKLLFTMLPKGPVTPSGPSPIINSIPTDSVPGQP